MNERFCAHGFLKKNDNFVKDVVDLYDLLAEYSTIKNNSSDQLKTFYLNEILVNFYYFLFVSIIE